jgi:hypothetical protein
MFTNERLFAFLWNSTLPSVSANKVWSLPIPNDKTSKRKPYQLTMKALNIERERPISLIYYVHE